MKTILNVVVAFILTILALPAMAEVADCHHDVAPFDIGRYDRDVKAGKVMQTAEIPVGTVWETNMKGGRWITCRTTKKRVVAILSDGTYYDIGCGNEIKIALPPKDLRNVVVPGASVIQVSKATACSSEEDCRITKWCDDNNAWYASKNEKGDQVRRCDPPGDNRMIVIQDKLHIQRNLEVSGSQTAKFTGWGEAPKVVVPPAPQVDVTVSGRCKTQGCNSQPIAKFVEQERASFCGIHTNDGRVFKLVRNTGSHSGALTVVDITQGINNGRQMAMAIGGYNIDQRGWDCDKAQDAVEKQYWEGMTNFFSLPNQCVVDKRLRPENNKVSS